MNYKLFLLFLLSFNIFLFCHKDIMMQEGYIEIVDFELKIDKELNQLNVKFCPFNTQIDSVTRVIMKINVDGIELENIYENSTIILANDKDSKYFGQKIIETNWIPSLDVTTDGFKGVRLYIK